MRIRGPCWREVTHEPCANAFLTPPVRPAHIPQGIGIPGRRRALDFPSVGQAVNTYLTHSPTADGVTASVRSFRRPGSSVGARWVGVGCRFSARRPGDLPALAFSAREREPSFYLGLCGPLLRSVHQGGIAYPGGLRPTGPAQNSNGCSPLYRSCLRMPSALNSPATLRTPSVVPDPR